MTYFLSDNPDIYQLNSLAVDAISFTAAQVQQALQASQTVSPSQQWTVYRDQLAQVGLVHWLADRDLDAQISEPIPGQSFRFTDDVVVNGFSLKAIATSSLDEAEVSLPVSCLEQPAQIYVLVEVAEELQQAWVKGFIRHDQLQTQISQPDQEFYDLPIALFDLEPGNLLLTLRCAETSTIPLPQALPTAMRQMPSVSLPDLSQTVLNVRRWLTDQADAIAEDLTNLSTNLSWVLLPQPAYAMRSSEGLEMRFASDAATELAQVLQLLRSQGVQLPADARGGYQNLEVGGAALRVYAMAGTVSVNPAEWSLLIILGGQSGSLPDGITLRIKAGTGTSPELLTNPLLVEQRFDAASQNAYLYADVIGNWDETFQVEIVLANGIEQTLPIFVYEVDR
ncbi:MAG: DUF1822 family protein [Synechococcales bacterium]|nr:DUF1822 family protein [Synechococcales bacterium]